MWEVMIETYWQQYEYLLHRQWLVLEWRMLCELQVMTRNRRRLLFASKWNHLQLLGPTLVSVADSSCGLLGISRELPR